MKKNLIVLFSTALLFSCSNEVVDSNLDVANVGANQTNISSTTKSTKQTIVPKASTTKPAKNYIPLKPDEVKRPNYSWMIYAGNKPEGTLEIKNKILGFMKQHITLSDMSRYTIDDNAKWIYGKGGFHGYYFEVELYDVPSKSLVKTISKDLELFLGYEKTGFDSPGLRLYDADKSSIGPGMLFRW